MMFDFADFVLAEVFKIAAQIQERVAHVQASLSSSVVQLQQVRP